MTDATLNRFLARGTNAQRLAFTPDPPTPASGPSPTYIWYETDTGDTYAWDGSAWDIIASGGYSDEEAQDAVGTILADSASIDFTYTDVTPEITAIVKDGGVTLAKMADVATATVFYRKTAGTGVPEVQTLATLKTDLGLTGINSGDQTTIVGISGTKAEFDAAVSDGNILYVGDVTQYTDEMAQDAVGAMIADTATIDLTYTDATPELKADIKDDSVTYAKIQNISATDKLLGRDTAGAGDIEEIGLGLGLEFSGSGTIRRATGTSFPGSPATGDIFWRSDSNTEYFYDGTRWLSTEKFTLAFGGSSATVTLATFICAVPHRGIRSIFIEDIQTVIFISAAGNWDVLVRWADSAGAATVLASQNQTTSGTYTDANTVVNAVLNSNARNLQLVLQENSGSATCFGGATLTYRLVG